MAGSQQLQRLINREFEVLMMLKFKRTNAKKFSVLTFVSACVTVIAVCGGVAVAEDKAVMQPPATPVGTPQHMRLLTTQQYLNTIQYFFGSDININGEFSPLMRTDGLLEAGS